MERTTISLPPELLRRLRLLAAEKGVSMATLIREAIEWKTGRSREASAPARRERGIRRAERGTSVPSLARGADP